MSERRELVEDVLRAVDREVGPVILPTASSGVFTAVRALREHDGTHCESFGLAGLGFNRTRALLDHDGGDEDARAR